jgi:hypothetical protein
LVRKNHYQMHLDLPMHKPCVHQLLLMK